MDDRRLSRHGPLGIDDGRYNFCGLPLGAEYLLAGCSGAVMPFPGFRFTKVPVEMRGDTVVDVDITSSISSCP